MSSIEQRQFARLETNLECTVVAEAGDFAARVANLSRTGAGLIGPPGKAEISESVMLMFERAEGGFSFALSSFVVRVTPRDGECVYGVQFEVMPPDVGDELARLLKSLVREKGQGRRESPRVAARLKVKCRNRNAFVAQLNDLSRGGISVRSAQAIEPGSTLTVQLGVESHPSLLTVSGKVLRTEPVENEWMVSVEFAPPSTEDRAQVLLLLDVLLGLGSKPKQGLDD